MRAGVADRWQGWAGFALGLWLALSPWIAGYAANDAATANAASAGLVLALLSHFQASFGAVAVQWLNLVCGLWLLAAPVMLPIAEVPVAAANSIAVGAVVVGLAASALELDKQISRIWHRASSAGD
jgi:hypothetical protein